MATGKTKMAFINQMCVYNTRISACMHVNNKIPKATPTFLNTVRLSNVEMPDKSKSALANFTPNSSRKYRVIGGYYPQCFGWECGGRGFANYMPLYVILKRSILLANNKYGEPQDLLSVYCTLHIDNRANLFSIQSCNQFSFM